MFEVQLPEGNPAAVGDTVQVNDIRLVVQEGRKLVSEVAAEIVHIADALDIRIDSELRAAAAVVQHVAETAVVDAILAVGDAKQAVVDAKAAVVDAKAAAKVADKQAVVDAGQAVADATQAVADASQSVADAQGAVADAAAPTTVKGA